METRFQVNSLPSSLACLWINSRPAERFSEGKTQPVAICQTNPSRLEPTQSGGSSGNGTALSVNPPAPKAKRRQARRRQKLPRTRLKMSECCSFLQLASVLAVDCSFGSLGRLKEAATCSQPRTRCFRWFRKEKNQSQEGGFWELRPAFGPLQKVTA